MNTRVKLHGSSTFVLVHGATSDASAWGSIAPFLKALGHRVYAVTLPGHGSDSANLPEQTMSSYGKYVADFICRLEEPVILVGHSMGGAVISVAGELIPEKICKLVYLAAWMLLPGQSCNHPDTSYEPHWFYKTSRDGKTVGAEDFYEIDENGNMKLRDRPEGFSVPQLYAHTTLEAMPDPLARESIAALYEPVYTTPERWGSIRRFYIECMRDDSITYEVEEKMLKNLPCELVYELDTGHRPQVTMPEELCVILHDIAMRD